MAGPLLTIYAGVAAGTQELWLVGIVPYSSGEWDTGISVAAGGQLMADNINANPALLPGYELKIAWTDGQCAKSSGEMRWHEHIFQQRYHTLPTSISSFVGANIDNDKLLTVAEFETIKIWKNATDVPTPVGLLGPGCSTSCMAIAKAAYMARTSIVSNSATQPSLSCRCYAP